MLTASISYPLPMEISHAISDAVLTIIGLLVHFRFIRPLSPLNGYLWKSFILAVTAAAFFGCLRFLGIQEAKIISEVFQHFAGSAGACCLILATYATIFQKILNQKVVLLTILVGFLCFLSIQFTNNLKLLSLVSTAAIPTILLLSVIGIFKGNRNAAFMTFGGVLVLIVATFNQHIIRLNQIDAIDIYHYLMSISLLLLGLSVGRIIKDV